MEKKIATIYDLNRMCMASVCVNCELYDNKCLARQTIMTGKLDYVNEIIIKWCETHPVKTRQSEFLKIFPNAYTVENGALRICPMDVDKDLLHQSCDGKLCSDCKEKYWLQEIK